MKRKLLLLTAALLCAVGSWAQPTASTPSVGNTYYLYNPMTKLFMTSSVNLPFVRPIGSAWKLEAAAGHDGWVTLRLKDNDTEGCGYFWGKWWANDPAVNSDSYSDERVYQLVNISPNNYKLKSYAWGATDAYIYINKGNEGDRSFRLACNSQDQDGLDEGYITWQFISEEDYESYMENDYTSQIKNNDFTSGLGNWTVVANTGNRQAHGNTAVEYWNSTAAGGGFDYYQELTGLPAGKYVLRAAMYNSTNGETVKIDDVDTPVTFDPAGQCGVYGTSNEITKYANVTVDGTAYNIYTTEGLLVTDGNLRLGLKNTATMTARWFGADWIQLTCIEYCLSTIATALPGSGAMEADTWYYYDIPTTDDYEFTSTSATTLTYSADGTQLISEATGTGLTFSATETKDISLTAGRIYFKTSAATTLSVSYKYNIGIAAADKAYIQPGQTVTVTWADASTNNPSASLTKDFSGVTFNSTAVTCTPTDKGFTFTVPTVAANTEYTLSIPANAIGYAAGSLYNDAQNIILKTPALYDGNYYFRVASTWNGSTTGTSAAVGKYLSRGANYGTRTTVDAYGQAISVTTDANNVSLLKMMDSQAYIYHANTWDSWADHGSIDASTAHTIVLTDGNYRISNNQNAGKYFKYNTSAVNNEEVPVYDDGTGANNGPIINWAVETVSQHVTAMQAKKDSQATTAATAAYNSGNYTSLNGITTVSDLESELTSNYIADEFVSPGAISSVEESYQPRNGADDTDPKIVYSNTIDIASPGFYKFSMQAFFRASNNSNTQAVHTAGADMPGAVLFFGNNETQIKSLYDEAGNATVMVEGNDAEYNGQYYANNTTSALTMFKNDKYHNDVWFYASEAGTYTYGVKVMGYTNFQWFIYSPQSVSVTSYSPAATSADYEALNAAISASASKTLGFDDGEYAPYKAAAALAAAKAIDQGGTNSKIAVLDAAANLNAAWVANDGEVNAISWIGSDYTDNTDSQTPLGWTDGNGGTIRISANYGSNSGLNSLEPKMVLNLQAATAYGETEGYTLPLNASTQYKLSFKYAGWGQTSGAPTITITDPSGTSVGSKKLEEVAKNNDATGEWVSVVIPFTSTSAGNYKVAIALDGGRPAFGEFNLVKVPAITIAETDEAAPTANNYANVTLNRTLSASYWNTFCSPINIADLEAVFGTGVSVTELDVENTTGNQLAFKTASSIVAGKPYLVKPLANVASPTINGAAVIATAGETVTGANDFKFIGTVPQITLSADGESSTLNYFLNTSGKLVQPSAEGSLKGMRAYFNVPASVVGSSVKLFINGLETAIESLDGADAQHGAIFNLAGQRVNKAQKGVYIVNGKKVIVK